MHSTFTDNGGRFCEGTPTLEQRVAALEIKLHAMQFILKEFEEHGGAEFRAYERWKEVESKHWSHHNPPTSKMIDAGQAEYPGITRGSLIILWKAMAAAAKGWDSSELEITAES